LLIDHINHPGDFADFGVRKPALPDRPAIVGIFRSALATRTCSRATPGAIEHDHDSQCVNDLKSFQYRIAPIASNSPSSSSSV
jgi:hypothetical protein